ncbi:hypothetical protein CPB85DRAFT_1343526 [Mucidula mucida]|nr:hypothetical protein CPB85DRAFT_1343526 [Mucidula mucida]
MGTVVILSVLWRANCLFCGAVGVSACCLLLAVMPEEGLEIWTLALLHGQSPRSKFWETVHHKYISCRQRVLALPHSQDNAGEITQAVV